MAISLKSISSGQRIMPPKIVLTGVGGIGKTSFASESPKPIFIFTEDGQGLLDLDSFTFDGGTEEKPNVVCPNWESLIECVAALYNEDHDYQTVVIDTIDSIETGLFEYTCKKHGEPVIDSSEKGAKFSFQRGYRAANDELRVLLQWLDCLWVEKNMAVIVLAHSDVLKFTPPDAEAYDRYSIRLHKILAQTLHDWTDNHLFANYRTFIAKDDAGFGKKKSRGVGTGERILYTEERPAWIAKNRYNLPPELPFPAGESWRVLQDAIAAGIQQKS